MKALILNCTLKPSPEPSNTEALANVVADTLRGQKVETELLRVLDHHIAHGVKTDMGSGDQWPALHAKLLAADILVIASPTWLGRPSSVAQQVLERMDAMITEMRDGKPVAYGKVAGVVCTGNEDGAHHVISEICGALIDIGYTIPPQAWTYWNRGPGPGKSYLQTDERHDWSAKTGRQAAANLVTVAQALRDATFRYAQ
jgi:multimeric flavodoxin WrbA